MPRNLDIAALRSFIAIVENGGVTKASKRLHLTQSGVSMQLKRLEESLSVALFDREGRGVQLTRIGEELLSEARKIVSLNDMVWERMTTPPQQGELKLGMPHDIVFPYAPDVLKRFNEDFPGVRVSLISPHTSELLRLFEAGEVDVIVTTEAEGSPSAQTLASSPLVWYGAPGGRAWRRDPTPIAFEPACVFRKLTFSALERVGMRWDWTICTNSMDAIYAAVAADLAVFTHLKGTAPQPLEEIDHGGALPDLPMIHFNLYVATGPTSDLAERLADYVRRSIENLSLTVEKKVAC